MDVLFVLRSHSVYRTLHRKSRNVFFPFLKFYVTSVENIILCGHKSRKDWQKSKKCQPTGSLRIFAYWGGGHAFGGNNGNDESSIFVSQEFQWHRGNCRRSVRDRGDRKLRESSHWRNFFVKGTKFDRTKCLCWSKLAETGCWNELPKWPQLYDRRAFKESNWLPG